MKLNHKQKVKKARQLLSYGERSTYYNNDGELGRKASTPLFQSRKWMTMKMAKSMRIRKRVEFRKMVKAAKVNGGKESSLVSVR